MRKIKGAGAIVYKEEPSGVGVCVLLVHRPKYQDWSFPKGKLDKGESAEVAACREVHEETGVPVRLGHSLGFIEYDTEGVKDLTVTTRKNVRYYTATQIASDDFAMKLRKPIKQASLKEIDDVKWFSFEEAEEKLTYRDDRELLKQFVNHYRNEGKLFQRVVVEIPRLKYRHKVKGVKIVKYIPKSSAKKVTGILSALGIDTLITFTKKPTAYKTFEKYALATGIEIQYFKNDADPGYAELYADETRRIAQISR